LERISSCGTLAENGNIPQDFFIRYLYGWRSAPLLLGGAAVYRLERNRKK
jgi:hypothetical protein